VLLARQLLDDAGITAEVEAKTVAAEDWAEAWKEYFQVERIGERIVIVPSWREYGARHGDAVIRLDPGMAFGTGQHATTRMCLEALERFVRPGFRVLDVGCGSGILSLAALKLGAAQAVALDVDSECVRITAENAAKNGVPIDARVGSLGEAWPFDAKPTGFDIVLANIIAGPLIEMAADLREALTPSGRLIASGVIAAREAEVVCAFQTAGLRINGVRAMGEWRCIEAVLA
jgi:ribosomal protein L11 methyltransferase